MRLSRWLELSKAKTLCKNKSYYAIYADSILVQICTVAKKNIDTSKSATRKWSVDDFEIIDSDHVILANNDCITEKVSPSQLNEYGLYELFLQILISPFATEGELSHLSILDLPSELQEFDTILSLLNSNDPYDFWDFPSSTALVDVIDVETGKLIKQERILIEEIDEIFVFPSFIKCNGYKYKVIESPCIHYSFLRKKYSIYVKRDRVELEKVIEYEIGVVALDKNNRRIFVPLRIDGMNSMEATLTVLPKPYLPYISISFVLRKKGVEFTQIDTNKEYFTVFPDICIYLSGLNTDCVRNLHIAVENNNCLYDGLIRADITISEEDKLNMYKEVEMQL